MPCVKSSRVLRSFHLACMTAQRNKVLLIMSSHTKNRELFISMMCGHISTLQIKPSFSILSKLLNDFRALTKAFRSTSTASLRYWTIFCKFICYCENSVSLVIYFVEYHRLESFSCWCKEITCLSIQILQFRVDFSFQQHWCNIFDPDTFVGYKEGN